MAGVFSRGGDHRVLPSAADAERARAPGTARVPGLPAGALDRRIQGRDHAARRRGRRLGHRRLCSRPPQIDPRGQYPCRCPARPYGVPALVAAKVALHNEMRRRGLRKSTMRERLKWHRPQIRPAARRALCLEDGPGGEGVRRPGSRTGGRGPARQPAAGLERFAFRCQTTLPWPERSRRHVPQRGRDTARHPNAPSPRVETPAKFAPPCSDCTVSAIEAICAEARSLQRNMLTCLLLVRRHCERRRESVCIYRHERRRLHRSSQRCSRLPPAGRW